MIVLDASALVDAVVGRPFRGWVLEQMQGQRIVAPAHQLAEVLSAVTRLERAAALQPADALQSLRDAWELDQELVLPTQRHLALVREFSGHVRVLDGLYLALAIDRDLPVVTTDARLGRAGVNVEVRCPT